MRASVVLSFCLISTTTMAGGRLVGNGGDIVVCENSKNEVERIEVLDHYEAKTLRGQTVNLGDSNVSVREKIDIATQRMARLAPEHAQRYENWAEDFLTEAQFLDDVDLVDIPDSQHSILPKNCRIQQIINQASVLLPRQKRYTIDNYWWQQLNNTQKAGLILHEVVYRDTLSQGQENSLSARWLSSLMASENLETMPLREFVGLMQQLEFTALQIQNVLVDLNPRPDAAIEFYNDDFLKTGPVVKGSLYHHPSFFDPLVLRHKVTFHDNGHLAITILEKPATFRWSGLSIKLAPQRVEFHPNQSVKLAVINSPIQVQLQQWELNLAGHLQFYESGNLHLARINLTHWHSPYGLIRITHHLQLYPNGEPKSFQLVDDTSLPTETGSFLVFKGGQIIQLNDAGKVIIDPR
ncbi:MAG: hypothetical protein H6626_12090 [Pseudobdellovibrionaceae bacterium]|nr:hypothetical protein [Bdellovibrionales bacterium]USN46928.1 MAG: hypothetical protein H6626_12090 [Pseudobdellovibrionaceae bacterium]